MKTTLVLVVICAIAFAAKVEVDNNNPSLSKRTFGLCPSLLSCPCGIEIALNKLCLRRCKTNCPNTFDRQKSAVLTFFDALESFNGTASSLAFSTDGSLTFDLFGTSVGRAAIAGLVNSFTAYPQPKMLELEHNDIVWYNIDADTLLLTQTEHRKLKSPTGATLDYDFPSACVVQF